MESQTLAALGLAASSFAIVLLVIDLAMTEYERRVRIRRQLREIARG